MPVLPATRRLAVSVLVAVTMAAAATVIPGPAAAEPADGTAARLLVGWRPGATAAATEAAARAAGVIPVDAVAPAGVAVVAVEAGRSTAALARLRADPSVAYAEPEQEVTAAEMVPTDPLWNEQWGPVLTRTTAAWDTTTGSADVVIAVLDSGVDAGHPDLAGALVPGTDLVNNDNDPADDSGHGTSVAGVAAARAGNGTGIAGYCWTCSVMPVKVVGADGSGSLGQLSSGITYAADRGARVINLSLSSPAPSVTVANAVAYARSRGALVVASAGNDGDPIPNYPAAAPGALGVVATDTADRRYSFSSHGPWAELAAPGCHTAPRRGGGYGPFCGTSSAAPAVAGIAALLLSARPGASLAELERALLFGADGQIASAAYGRVDADAAMAVVTAPPPVAVPGSGLPGPPVSVSAGGGNGAVTVRWEPPVADGGNPVRSFRLTASPGGLTAEVKPTSTSFVLGPLSNGVDYSVSVAAVTAAGAGPAVASAPPARPLVGALERVSGAGRVETAVALSRRAYQSASGVVVARSDDYADVLTAAPVAATRENPLLLSPPDQLPTAVAAEVRRLGARRALLVGGATALSPEVEAGLRAAGVTTVDRVAGGDRFDTARLLAPLAGGGRSAYVTEGANEDPSRGWPDAVAVSGLAAYQRRAILLVTRDELPAPTKAALAAMNASAATVIGGRVAVSDEVANALADPDGDGTRQVSVTRVGGTTRWDTSRLVADRALAAGAGAHRLWIATGRDWPDALAAGPAAAAKAAVTLLVDGQDLAASPPASAWLAAQNRRFLEVVLVGGTSSTTADTEAGLTALLR